MTRITESGGATDLAAVLGMLVGVLVFGYGVLLVQQSPLGGVHVAAIGFALFLSGLFLTERGGALFGLSPAGRRRASLACVGLAAVLLVAFVALNGATFESGEMTGSG